MAATAAVPRVRELGRRELVMMIALVMSLNALAIDVMLPALDEIGRDLGAIEGNRRQLVIGIYLLASGIGCLIPGVYADRFGRRPLVLFALASYAILSVVCVFINDFDVLLGARAVQGFLSAGLMVVPMAVIRDQYEGDQMARLMSLVSAVFITVPVLAPTLGQGVLLFANWRAIFFTLAALSVMAAMWVYVRLPETLAREHRQDVRLRRVLSNMRGGLFDRQAIGYVIGGALLFGGVFGYINSAQQLLGEHFGVGELFPLVFGATAATMAFASIINSRIVERFGARRVSHTGVILFIAASVVQVYASQVHPGELAWFLPVMAVNLGLLGFLGANFSSIAMQPFAATAGAASSVQTFIRMAGAAVVGLAIGQAYDGSARPFAFSLLIASVLALLLVLYSEQGRLFRRLRQPHRSFPHVH